MTIRFDAKRAQPFIIRNCVDGPLLYLRYGAVHRLTRWERLQLWLGFVDIYGLERKWWNRLLPPNFGESKP